MNEMKPFLAVYLTVKTVTDRDANTHSFSVGGKGYLTIAASEAEAREQTRAHFLPIWPPEQGWIEQAIDVHEITENQLRGLLACYPDLSATEPEGFTM